MTELNRAGQPASLGGIDSTQQVFRNQIDALTDTVRQLGGKPFVGPGNGSDPLTAPFILYVNPYIGSDTYVAGEYNSQDDGTFESKMRRISLQQLECGYAESRPFKTISRAIIEAGIITSYAYLNLDPAPCGDLVSIVLAPGLTIANNGPGDLSTPVWDDGKEPTLAELTAFNGTDGGIILPRGCSLISLDLRKTIIRPDFVPTPTIEQANGANRRAIFKVTGGCYMFGYTFMDKKGSTTSHHLLDTHHFCSEAELDVFYSKIRSSFGPAAGVSDDYATARSNEYVIVGPTPTIPTVATDTVRSSSPYIYNMSIRSTLGMSGIFADGAKTDGFKSIVVAQYTGVSLQNDPDCWQKYEAGAWTSIGTIEELQDIKQDNSRINPQKRHYHIRAVNDAVIQEVSVFCIGQAVHHSVESGAQLTVTNSNSNFGGCSSLAVGYQNTASASDTNWTLKKFVTALNPLVKDTTPKKIFLGTLVDDQPNNSTTLTLATLLVPSQKDPNQPEKLVVDGYSLEEDNYLWVENPGGPDYRALLSAAPFSDANPDEIELKASLTAPDEDGNEISPGDPNLPNVYLPIAKKRVYVRRFVDTRSIDERRYSFIVEDVGSNNLRLPVRDYVVQKVGQVEYSPNNIQSVAASQRSNLFDDGVDGVKVEIRYAKRTLPNATYSTTVYYRKADVVIKDDKHFTAIRENYGGFNVDDWDEAYVHMQENFNPEGYFLNAKPIIVFNKDTSPDEDSVTLGNSINDTLVQAQLTSAVDYQGLRGYLVNLGVANPTQTLKPKDTEAERYVTAPAEPVEFRRPSNIRLYSHAFEWPGFGSYSRALPQYQGDMSPNNKFTYYFTASDGGKCYVSGFNEEGLQVSNRGLEDLTTGTVLSVSDIGNPDVEIEIPTVFETLEVIDKLILAPGCEIIGFPGATTTQVGIGEIASLADISNGIKNRPTSDADIDSSGANFLNTPGVNYWAENNGVVTAPLEGIAIKVIHVIPQGVTPLTGTASVPYGFPATKADGTQYVAGVSEEASTITEAMIQASRIYVPTGASILISLHGDLPDVEVGPLQLVNSYASVDVAGAQGYIPTGGNVSPQIKLASGITEKATKRIPQYGGVNALSAGVTFADCTVKVDCANTKTYLCFNGGIGIGGMDMVIEWENVEVATVMTNSYGESANIYYYNTATVNRNFVNYVKSSAGLGDFGLNVFGTSGGLAGHGTDVIIDFKSAAVGAPGEAQFTYVFKTDVSGQSCQLSFMEQGSRGGVRLGGRVAPIVDLDFGSTTGQGDWDLSEWVNDLFCINQNYMGVSFEMRPYPDGSSPRTTWRMSTSAYNSILSNPKILSNGCCIDIGSGSSADKAGIFGLYLEVDRYEGNDTPETYLLTAKNNFNAYIYGDTARNTD